MNEVKTYLTLLHYVKSLKPKCDQVIFVVAPSLKAVEKIKYQADRFIDVDIRVLFIPRKTEECVDLLVKNYNVRLV